MKKIMLLVYIAMTGCAAVPVHELKNLKHDPQVLSYNLIQGLKADNNCLEFAQRACRTVNSWGWNGVIIAGYDKEPNAFGARDGHAICAYKDSKTGHWFYFTNGRFKRSTYRDPIEFAQSVKSINRGGGFRILKP